MRFVLITSILLSFGLEALAEDVHKLSVSGSSVVYKAADKLSLTIGVETYEGDLNKAKYANAEKMNKIFVELMALGLTEKEVQTKEYTITPQQNPAPKNPPIDWKPSIVGYRVRNLFEIKTSKLDLADKIVDVAGYTGANFIENIMFSLQDEELAKAEAITKAISQAQTYAKAAVNEAGIKLGGIIDLSINNPFVNRAQYKAISFAVEAQDISTPISPRDVEVSASVSLVYEIHPPGFFN